MRDYNKCRALGHEVKTIIVQSARQTHWSPAEYDEIEVCTLCDDDTGYDEEYERAAANYDDEDGKDWR